MNPAVDARVQQARLAVGDQAFFARICAADDPDQAVEEILQEQLRARLDRLEALIVAATDPAPPAVPSPPPTPSYILDWNARAEAAEASWRRSRGAREGAAARREAEWNARWDAREAARNARRAIAEAKREARRIAREEACKEHQLRRRRPFTKVRIPMPDEDAWVQACSYTYDDHNFPVDAPVDLRDDADAFYREASGWALVGLHRARPFSAERRGRSGNRAAVDQDRESSPSLNSYDYMSDPLYPWQADVACTAQRREAW